LDAPKAKPIFSSENGVEVMFMVVFVVCKSAKYEKPAEA
jgi:hypothetical protein